LSAAHKNFCLVLSLVYICTNILVLILSGKNHICRKIAAVRLREYFFIKKVEPKISDAVVFTRFALVLCDLE